VRPRYQPVLDDPLIELLGRTAAGYEPAFNDIYRATCRRVYGTVQRIVQNDSLSCEVTQDVFVEVWRYAHRYDRRLGSVMTWTLTIARRRAVDRVRHEERHHRRDTRYVENHPETDVDVFGEVDRAIDADHVRAALEHLTARQRQAVELAYLDGYSNVEIARLLNIPLGTTKTRIRDGLRRLRATLDEQHWLIPSHDNWSAALGPAII